MPALTDWKTKGECEKLGYSTQLAEYRWLLERHLPKGVIQSLTFAHLNKKSKQKDGAEHSVCQHEYLYKRQHKKLQLDDVENKLSTYLLTTCCSRLQRRMQLEPGTTTYTNLNYPARKYTSCLSKD